jgi:hypothetical protein
MRSAGGGGVGPHLHTLLSTGGAAVLPPWQQPGWSAQHRTRQGGRGAEMDDSGLFLQPRAEVFRYLPHNRGDQTSATDVPPTLLSLCAANT